MRNVFGRYSVRPIYRDSIGNKMTLEFEEPHPGGTLVGYGVYDDEYVDVELDEAGYICEREGASAGSLQWCRRMALALDLTNGGTR